MGRALLRGPLRPAGLPLSQGITRTEILKNPCYSDFSAVPQYGQAFHAASTGLPQFLQTC
jgi:hypothetical protein